MDKVLLPDGRGGENSNVGMLNSVNSDETAGSTCMSKY